MNELTEICAKVLPLSDIPEELLIGSWLNDFPKGCLVEVHIDEEEPHDSLDVWLLTNFPKLDDDNSFLINIDY